MFTLITAVTRTKRKANKGTQKATKYRNSDGEIRMTDTKHKLLRDEITA